MSKEVERQVLGKHKKTHSLTMTRDMHIKTTWYHFSPISESAGEDLGKREAQCQPSGQ